MQKIFRHSFYVLVVFAVTSVPSIYYLFKQLQESKIVNNYLVDNKLNNLPITKESAFLIARQVAKDFNVNQKTFKVLKMNQRPFLREDAGTLLICKEGLCGEGTRVIIRLLSASGYDATRITLYDRYMQHAHTLISVEMKSGPLWINSINSVDSLTTLLENENISTHNFEHLLYTDNIEERVEKIQSYRSAEKSEEFKRNLDRYYLFSYEAIPVTKILSKIGINVRVFNLQRPPRFISVLAEEPYMVMFLFYLLLSIVMTYPFSRVLIKILK